MKFIADSMLGTLAKWLRFFGYNTLYFKNIDDKEILNIAKKENRIILTRDKKLKGIYVKSDNLQQQLKQLIEELNLNFENALMRCSVCNSELEEVSKEEVKGKVADGVFLLQEEFWKCPNCNKFYWKGTHYRNIVERMREFR